MDKVTSRPRVRGNRIPGAALVLGLLLAGPARAVDGVIEINQARALAGGVTTGDQPGFPVSITTPGSYRLTGDLTVPAGWDGIAVSADNVTIDLNGFSVVGGGGTTADGISLPAISNIEVKNGTVRGFSRTGIFTSLFSQYIRVLNLRVTGNSIMGIDLQGTGNLVDGCVAWGNNIGIRALGAALVTNSVARGNTSFGLALDVNGGYRSCVLSANNGGDASPQVSGGLQLGSNVCGTDLTCP